MLPRAAAVDDGGSAVADGRRAIIFPELGLHFSHFCVTCVNLQMSACCIFVSPVCTPVHFCVTSLHFSALQILLVMNSEDTSAFIFFVSKKCTNKIKTDVKFI